MNLIISDRAQALGVLAKELDELESDQLNTAAKMAALASHQMTLAKKCREINKVMTKILEMK